MIRRGVAFLACLAITSGAACSPLSPQSGFGHARGSAAVRDPLQVQRWRVVYASGETLFVTGVALIKHVGTARFVEVSGRDLEKVIPVAKVASIDNDDGRSTQRRTATFVNTPCEPGAEDCGSVPDDLCDPTVQFCCPPGPRFAAQCTEPTMYGTIGCYNDEPCGDDGAGNAEGTALILFPGSYCWYEFSDGIFVCYSGTFDANGPPLPPQNLFVEYVVSPPTKAFLQCSTEGRAGFAYALYRDPAPTGSTGTARHQIVAGLYYQFTYPDSFNGKPDVSAGARMFSNFYRSVVPINIGGNQIGYCNGPNTG